MTPPNHDFSNARPQPVPTELQRGVAAENTDLDYEDDAEDTESLERQFQRDVRAERAESPQRTRTMNLPGARPPEPVPLVPLPSGDYVREIIPINWMGTNGQAIHTVIALTLVGRIFTLDVTAAPEVVWNEIPGPEL